MAGPLGVRVALPPSAAPPSAAPPSAAPRPVQSPVQKSKPDPRPARLILSAAGVAAASALATAIVLPPREPGLSADVPDSTQAADMLGSPLPSAMQSGVLYVVLAPGQTAPPGATVVDVTPSPRGGAVGGSHTKKGSGGGTVATNGPLQPQPGRTATPAPTPTPKRATPTPVKTSQSGKKP